MSSPAPLRKEIRRSDSAVEKLSLPPQTAGAAEAEEAAEEAPEEAAEAAAEEEELLLGGI